MKQVWVILLLAATALAGCADGGTSSDAEDEQIFEGFEEDAKVSSDKGLIRGVVLDEVIQPIVGARVTLVQTDQTIETNENGAFVFGDLEPGSYFLKATALGYESIQQSVEVVAGVAQPAAVKILLPADPAGLPYFEAETFEGYIDCSTYVGVLLLAACGILADFGLSDDEFATCIYFDPNLTFMQNELVWESTQTLGDQLYVSHTKATVDNCGYDATEIAGDSIGPSPLLTQVEQEPLANHGIGTTHAYYPRIFSWETSTVPLVGVTLQQRFAMYAHGFHGYLPPEDWRFTDDQDVPQPM